MKKVSELTVDELDEKIKHYTENFAIARIEAVIEQTMDKVLKGYGFDTSNSKEVQSDMIFLTKQRKGAEQISLWSKRSFFTAAISGAIFLLCLGLKGWISNILIKP